MYQEITRERQRAATVELAAEIREHEAALEARRSEPPRPGDTFVSRRTVDFPVEWLVVDADDGRVRVVALDAHPFVGSRDLVLPERAPGDAGVLRCDVDAWLDAAELEGELRTGTLGEVHVEDVRRRRRTIEEKALEPSLLEEEVDGDPEYRHWCERTLRPAVAALTASAELVRVPAEVVELPRTRRRRWPVLLAAASVLLAFGLPLGWQVYRLSRQLEDERTKVAEAARERTSLEERLASSQGEVEHVESALRDLREATERTLADQTARIEARLRRALDRGVVVNVPSFVLARAERERAGRGLAESIDPGGASRFTLSLEVSDPDPNSRYRLEIIKKDSREEAWSTDGLFKYRGKWLRLDVPADLFEPAEYELLIYALDSDPPKLLNERYVVKLEQ